MADTDSLDRPDLDALQKLRDDVSLRLALGFTHGRLPELLQRTSALISYARSLESRLAEKDATVAHEDRSADEALRRLRTLSSSACPGCKGTHYKDIDTVAAEIASLRSQLAETRELAMWVADTYTIEGREIWWRNWDAADETKRRRMYVGLAEAQ